MCECESRYPHNGKCFNEYSTKIAAVYGQGSKFTRNCDKVTVTRNLRVNYA